MEFFRIEKVAAVFTIIVACVAIWEFALKPDRDARRNAEIAIYALSRYEIDYEGASDIIDIVRARRPNNRIFLLAAGLARIQSKAGYDLVDYSELTRAARRLNRDGRPHYLLGVVQMRRDEPCRAIEHFRESLERQRGFAPARSQLASAQMVAKFRGESCGDAGTRGVDINAALSSMRVAAEDHGGASLFYHLADSLVVAANLTGNGERQSEYMKDADLVFQRAVQVDEFGERRSRMEARWAMLNHNNDVVRGILETLTYSIGGRLDAATFEWCSRRTLRARLLLEGAVKNWGFESMDSPGPELARMEALRRHFGDGSTLCKEIKDPSAPLLWSASQAVAAMAEGSN